MPELKMVKMPEVKLEKMPEFKPEVVSLLGRQSICGIIGWSDCAVIGFTREMAEKYVNVMRDEFKKAGVTKNEIAALSEIIVKMKRREVEYAEGFASAMKKL